VASPAMGHWGTCPLDFQHFIFSSLWSKSDSQLSKYYVVCMRDQLVQMSTTHSYFNQYCISHKTVGHRTAAAPGPEVRSECPTTSFPTLPLLATNPDDATKICKLGQRGGEEFWDLLHISGSVEARNFKHVHKSVQIE